MRIEKRTTSVSWIPSDSIPGFLKLPFERGVMHYDPPPPLALDDLAGMRERGELRFANRLRAYIEIEDGRIVGSGYLGALLEGFTPITIGRLRILLPAKAIRDIQWQPAITGEQATFVQTSGCRPGFSLLKPSVHWPFLVTRPFTVWTTLRLTISLDGSSSQEIIGASPFPRHWLYDNDDKLVGKTALTRNQLWLRTVFGTHTPWGGEDQVAAVAEAETPLERALADKIMGGSEPPSIRRLASGEYLFRQGATGGSLALILDGNLEVRVDDRVVGHVGPGAVVGERATLEGTGRTAAVRALTETRVAESPQDIIDIEELSQLARIHHREHLPQT